MRSLWPGRRRWLIGGVLLAALVVPTVCAPGGGDPLESGFRNPPAETRMRCYWWWLNGNTTKQAITRDLEAMKAKGYAGALLVDAGGAEQRGNRQVPAGPMFASPEWRELFRHTLAEAARLNLEISLNVTSGWNLGGPTVKPEHASKLLTWSRVTVSGPREFREKLPQPKLTNGFYREVATVAYPLRNGPAMPKRPISQLSIKIVAQEAGFSTPKTDGLVDERAPIAGEEDSKLAEVVDVTGKLAADGSLTWSVPAGEWEILRVGYTCSDARVSTSSGAWQGLAIDYLDRAAFETFWRDVLDPVIADSKPYLGGALRYLATDSWELGGANWTDAFRQEFRARRGYDLLPYLPVIAGRILDDRQASNRFLNDFRRTIGDLVIASHYRPFAEMAARYKLGIHPESGGPHGAPVDALETLGVGAFPQMEFWARSATHRVKDEDRFFVKQAASAAHTYGKTIVAAEGPTSIGPHWDESIGDNLKPTFDQAICEGLNRIFWHTFTSSPASAGLPGQEYFAGTHLNPNVTWWSVADGWFGYINRSQFLMQQGLAVADAVYYYGDHVPNFAQMKSSDPARVLPGYDYDSADLKVLTTRMTVRDGRIVLPDGMSYRLIVLPERTSISLAGLRAVKRLVDAGATVIGPKPTHATGLGESDADVRAIADELWGSGKIRAGQTGRQALAAMGIAPDFAGPDGLDYIHRRTADTEIYFVRNGLAQAVSGEAVFRVSGKAPEFWHADTGNIEPVAVYDDAEGRTRIPLRLDANGSVFVIFRRRTGLHVTKVAPAGSDVRVDLTKREMVAGAAGQYQLTLSDGSVLRAEAPAIEPSPVVGPWMLEFPAGPKASLAKLESWTASADPGVKYFSGTAKYRTRFDARAGEIALDLGDVREIARVRLNGRDLGILWKKPFQVEATAKAGANDLEIEVTNFWPNRLIGDQKLPEAQRTTRTNITRWTADSPLMPSGLLGPVTVRRTERAKLK